MLRLSPRKVTSNNSVNDGNWHHVAVTRKDATLSVFIDGVFDNSFTVPGTAYLSNSANLLIGEHPCASVDGREEFEGQLDEVRIWQVARTEEDFQQERLLNLSGNQPGLVGYWQFNEQEGDTVFDLSGSANNGTLRQGVNRLENDGAPLYTETINNEIVYSEDFEDGIGSEWSSSLVNNSYPNTFTAFSGRFNNGSQTLTLDTKPGETYTLSL